jgi:hypothetical protein
VPGKREGALLAGGIALAGLAINLVLVGVGIDDLLTRNVLAIWTPAAVAVAGGFAAPRARVIGPAAAALLCAIGLTAAVSIATDRNLQRPDWRGVARLLGSRPHAGSARAILVQHYRDLLPLSLYLPHLKFMKGAGATVSELDVVSFTSPNSEGFCWWGSACNLWPSRMQRSYPIAGFRPASRRQVYQFTVLRLEPTRSRTFLTPAAVSAALRTTRLRNDELLIQR